jgi:4-amino-4-deoxy-L-arabinose transferase-like glycosyltransferase
MNKKTKLALAGIVFLAAALRLLSLTKFPAGFTADEAAQGYTAYSILKTGKDEWGIRLPLTPRSFGDFKPPLYTYLTLVSVALLGLNEFAVRLPAAVFGTLSVLMTFFLVKELFPQSRKPNLALLASFFLAVSPWHFSLSRAAFEANLTSFLIPLGLWFFLKGVKSPKYWLYTAFVFGLNLFSYHAAKVFTPLFLILLVFWRWQELKKSPKQVFSAGAIFILLTLLAFYSTLTGGGSRAVDISIFSAGFQAPKLFLDHYLSYFSLEFLFTRGAGEATYGMIPGRGVLYLFELVLLSAAIFSLVKKWQKNFLPILGWLILGPIPVALSLGVGYHANRVAVMMPAVQILSAFGLVVLANWQFPKQKLFLAFFGVWIFILITSFLWAYFVYFPKVSAPAMAYGWRQLIEYLTPIENKFEKIIINREFSEPQAFIAFYKKWPPADFQDESQDWFRYQAAGLKFVDQLDNYHLGKYEFRDFRWQEEKDLKNIALIGKKDDFPPAGSFTKRIIPYPDGDPAFVLVEL